ncbi:hypothetical protein O1611_g480 [Lasiodiplodia mahajangana]|uniref:Uncharacterized protein n=1 Tax=Lasiodiplodia mahajangana TaxID=1108764 RepID=A0ACC2K031_9PEZI|nr:hypothetical protein O1611_g480 [Lasiodiplodia mahajangana]
MATIYEGLRDLFYNPRYSDLDIVCRDGGKFKGQAISQIELPDVEFNTLYMLLQFFYGGNYNDYENIGSFHSPSYVIFKTPEEIDASLEVLPCIHVDLARESAAVDGDYQDEQEQGNSESEDEYEESDESDENHSHGDSSSGDSEDRDKDERLTRTFQGHNLFDSLNVYCLASRFNILPLKLLARDRFYRTAEKVLISPNTGNGEEARWWAHDHQRVYREKLARAVFDDFPRAVHELYETVPESDTMMRAIPPMLIAAGYNNDEFRDHMKPLLEKYPDLALAVVECMRMPNSLE